jgi:hypothetical protein
MNNEDESREFNEFSLPGPSSRALRGRQSVRATFKLTEKAIEALSIVSVHLGIKQKSLFDHLMEDTDSLNHIAKELESYNFKRLIRIQKTYVLSRKTLSCLESAAKEFDTPRDALVEYSIQRLLPVIIKEREKHLRRKKVLDDLVIYLDQGEKLLKKSKERLGEDDPVYARLKSSFSALISAYQHIGDYVERGKIIEDF